MMIKRRNQSCVRPQNSGISLIEVTIATAIVGGLMVAALNTVGATAVGRQITGDRTRAGMLAQDLMAEILSQAYVDAAAAPGDWGLRADETTGNRSKFDDVDDYDGWASVPPQEKSGAKMTAYADWSRSVKVNWVSAKDLVTVDVAESGVKRIIVTVNRGGAPLATLTAVRTFAADELSQ